MNKIRKILNKLNLGQWALVLVVVAAIGCLAYYSINSHADNLVARTYYVAPTGNDAADGSAATPFRTLRKSLVTLKPGDTLLVHGGTYTENLGGTTPILINSSATANRRIQVRAVPGEEPVLVGLLWLTNANYWTIDNLDVRWNNTNINHSYHMVKLSGGTGWTYQNSEIGPATSYAAVLVARTVAGVSPKQWTIQDNCIHDTVRSNHGNNQDHNIYVNAGTGAGVSGTISHNLIFNATNGNNIKLGGASAGNYDSSNITVSYNTLYNGSGSNLLAAWSSANNTVDHNIFGKTNQPGAGNIRGYDLGNPSGGQGNIYKNNWGFNATKQAMVLEFPVGRQHWTDGSGNLYGTDPQFNSLSCTGFHPQNQNAAAYGRWANAIAQATASPTVSPVASPSASASPISTSPSSSFSPSPTAASSKGSKPAAGTNINPNQALSTGLASLVALNEGSGNSFYDAVTHLTYRATTLNSTPAGAVAPAWITPTNGADYPWNGLAISNNGGAVQAIESNLPPSRFIPASSGGYTYAALIQPLDTTTFGRIMDAAGAAVITMYLNVGTYPGQVASTWRNAAGTAVNPHAPFVVNKWILVVCTVRQGLGVMYINGTEVARNTTVDLAKSVANQTGNLSFNTTGAGGGIPNANLSSFWIWSNRVLTASEVATMYQDPWAMLR